jgi:hypothetical protein
MATGVTNSFFDLAELFEFLAQSTIVGMPGEPSVPSQWWRDVVDGDDLPNEQFGHVVG